MAGIAGIYCADGRPAEVAELRRMVAAVGHRGPDGISYWNAGPIAFAHLQFHSAPESLHERQPLILAGGEACLVWSGRIDNREELLAELAAQGTVPTDETDPGIASAAYLTWGTDCVQHIVGDFVLALWDASRRRLWCARDYIGIRPFYYFWNGKTFLFGPEIRALLAHPLVSLKVNEGMAGEFLANAITSRDETLYSDIRRLPSGSALTVESGRLRIEPWWRPELGLINYRSDDEYAQHFRHLFDQSIRNQIRCNGPWGIELSGGLDSSSIAVSAREVLRGNRAKDGRILTFSVADPDKPWDESEDIAAVVDKAELTSEILRPLKVDIDFFRQRASYWRDIPGSPNGEPITLPMYEAAKQRGVRVLLTGIGGDEWLDGRPECYADLVARITHPGAFGELLHRARSDWRERSNARHWSIYLARSLASLYAPDWFLFRRRKGALTDRGVFSRDFLKRTHLAERMFAPEPESRRFASRAQRGLFNLVTNGFEAHVLEANERETALAGIDLRFPFFDRRLAEFCLRLPEEQRQKGTVWKRLLRNAMAGRLPERLRTKAYKAEFSDLFSGVFYAPSTQERIRHLAIPRHADWFEPHRLQERVAAATKEPGQSSSGPWILWRMLAADLWFEQVVKAVKENSS
ncbi:MAG TPA: asparagine synthase-related protein [Acidobacteriaceae bacterium]|nr:asparagine synthase-related protein [Acidobacteriaceae bacterium]